MLRLKDARRYVPLSQASPPPPPLHAPPAPLQPLSHSASTPSQTGEQIATEILAQSTYALPETPDALLTQEQAQTGFFDEFVSLLLFIFILIRSIPAIIIVLERYRLPHPHR